MSFHAFVLGIYLVIFGAGIGLLEFQVPPKTYEYASFLFSFAGRGVFYTLVGAIMAHGGFIRITSGLLIFGVGIMYIVLDRIPGIAKPENMNVDALSMGFDADADIDNEFA
ncbi:hypothetical protein BABINDRAFT_162473 [Babjeviella inositovora NRRL Y-12698]|uniref:Golgi apparatus membrane protein TVP15 n=1 Tax=Babjeviella inositovora NRRL Y-12698 TaxID=984486 RepID=A0A1E3QMB2_9ASCO|nr:uncharacterized protein BABINDRAFT_162473 [Babjeviella inositovora NRRL Y-12698]ODQ78790.1 hypothetical protein BABINDRAFT_162473 [Babjeviella inositovora NRRL Y-12698]